MATEKRENSSAWVEFSIPEYGGSQPTKEENSARQLGKDKVYLSAFQFLLSSQWDFLICLKFCKFQEYQAHPYSNVSTKTHCTAKYKLVLGLLIEDHSSDKAAFLLRV